MKKSDLSQHYVGMYQEEREVLKHFYNDYQAWLDAGAPEGKPFTRHGGLCVNLCIWRNEQAEIDKKLLLSSVLIIQFKEEGLAACSPFGLLEYVEEKKNGTGHLNKQRILWIKNHL